MEAFEHLLSVINENIEAPVLATQPGNVEWLVVSCHHIVACPAWLMNDCNSLILRFTVTFMKFDSKLTFRTLSLDCGLPVLAHMNFVGGSVWLGCDLKADGLQRDNSQGTAGYCLFFISEKYLSVRTNVKSHWSVGWLLSWLFLFSISPWNYASLGARDSHSLRFILHPSCNRLSLLECWGPGYYKLG